MSPETEKLVKMAQSRGCLSAAQREMILNKAREMGDDTTEVEFILSALPENAGAQAQQNSTTQQPPRQQTYQQPSANQQQYQQQYAQPNTGIQKPPYATAAFVLSICSIPLGLLSFIDHLDFLVLFGFAAGIVALFFSINLKKLIAENPEQYADNNIKTTWILSIIGTAINAVMIAMAIIMFQILDNQGRILVW